MTDKVIDILNHELYRRYINNEEWRELFHALHDIAMVNNRYVTELKEIIEDGLGIDISQGQHTAFLEKMKSVLAAGFPNNPLYKTLYKGIRLRPWLQSREWTNIYGLSLDDAINILIEADYNIEETPDMGTILWEE